MKIDQHNYETYLLDYIEGRLDRLTLAELEGFLSIHPELKKELESFEAITITPENIIFPDKKNLKKFSFDTTIIDDKNFTDYCIAFNEHLLSTKKTNEFFAFLEQHQLHKKEFDLSKETNLRPQKIMFDQKQKLYKNTIPNSLTKSIVRWSSLAAGVLAMAGIYSLFIKSNETVRRNSYSNVVIEQRTQPEIPVMTKHKNISIQYRANKSKLIKTNILPHVTSNDTLNNKVAEREEEIAYIPSISVTNIENPVELNSEINLNNTIYEADYETSKKQTLLKNLTTKLSRNINLLKNTRGKISLVKVAQLGLTGINQITNSNMRLTEKTDASGNITALSFKTGLFEYHKIKSD